MGVASIDAMPPLRSRRSVEFDVTRPRIHNLRAPDGAKERALRASKKVLAGALTLAAGAALGFSGQASAAFPNYSDCPRALVNSCLDIQSQSGTLTIGDFEVPLGAALEIRGGIRVTGNVFVPPTGTTGLFASPVAVPGGLLGIDFPGSFDDVYATPVLAGSPSDIHINIATFAVSLPLKLHLEHPVLGSHCYIGSNSNPVRLVLNTTRPGTPRPGSPGIILDDQVSGDTTFSIPGATGCGLGLGLVNGAINLKLGLPSASGNNSITTTNDIGIAASTAVS